VRESVIDIMLNLKSLVIEKESMGIEWITLKKKK
jgi:DNA-directed RNA polymerase alpha subunit